MQQQIPLSEGGRILLGTIKDELFPVIERLKTLLIDTQGLRIKFYVYSPALSRLNKEYATTAAEFFVVSRKLNTPDMLFSGLKDNPKNIVDYFQFRNAFSQNIDEGSRYIEIIDRTLDRKNQDVQNFRTLFLSLMAIVASMLTLFT